MRITKQPTDKAKKDKETLSLSCVVEEGRSTFVNYQWYRDGAKLEGQTSDTLERKLSLADDGAKWWCRITNDVGTVETRHASTTVKPLKKVIEINENVQNLNLYDEYTRRFPNAEGVEKAEFIIGEGVEVTSSSTSKPALDTGTGWDSKVSLKLSVFSGAVIAGRGGKGSTASGNGSTTSLTRGGDGGTAFKSSSPINVINRGIIGGGGGGGGGALLDKRSVGAWETYAAGGGGGASYGDKGLGNLTGSGTKVNRDGHRGKLLTGGKVDVYSFEAYGYVMEHKGGVGGDLGASGGKGHSWLEAASTSEGGTAGHAIQGVSNVTFINRGDIRGKTV